MGKVETQIVCRGDSTSAHIVQRRSAPSLPYSCCAFPWFLWLAHSGQGRNLKNVKMWTTIH